MSMLMSSIAGRSSATISVSMTHKPAAALSIALIVAWTATAADTPSAESLIQRSIDRSGGAEAYAKAKNVVMTGAVEMLGHNLTGSVAIYQQGPKMYTAIELPGIGKVEE